MLKPSPKKENVSRLYLAIWPDKDTQNRLQSMQHSWTWPAGASVVKPESFHLTLHFLGDVPNPLIPGLIVGLSTKVKPFDLIFCRHQLLGRGIAVLKPSSIPGELTRLHAQLGEALDELNVPVEKRTYRPHVTFARNAANAIAPTAQQVQPVLWHVTNYALVKSENGYQILHHFVSS